MKVRRFNIFITFLLLSLIISCQKDIFLIEDSMPVTSMTESTQGNKIQVIWQRPMGVVDTNIYLNEGVIIANDKVVATPAKSNGTITYFWDKRTGNYLFKWDDWIRPANLSTPVQFIDDKIYGNSGYQAYLADNNTGQTIWRSTPIDRGDPRTTISLGHIFHTTRDKSPQTNNFAFLTSLDIETGVRDTLMTIPKIDNYNPNLEPPAGWIAPTGDSLLIFVNRSLNFGGDLDERLDAYAYNMTADSIEWRLLDFDLEGSARVGPPLIEEDLVYISGEQTLYCLNAADGTTVWEHRFEDDTGGFSESLFISAMIKAGHRLVISPTNRNTYCFDAYTGEQLWKETDSASSPQNMIHHNGIIYVVSEGRGQLMAFDLETGEHYWREYPPNRRSDSRAGFFNEIAIDPETGYIYADDRFFVLCIKPYERE